MQRSRRNSPGTSATRQKAEFEKVPVAEIRKGRRGKHHDLLSRVLKDLKDLPEDVAIKIPLAESDGVTLANLRSAVHRGTSTRGITIETLSDEENFYVWKSGKS
jgi:hypothetical protein